MMMNMRPLMTLSEKLLYRGDAASISQFDMAKSSDRNLYGPGIYLTDDAEVAADYTLKGSTQVVFSDPEAKNQREIIAGYIRHLIDEVADWKKVEKDLTQDWAMQNVKGHRRGDTLPGMSEGHWSRLKWFLADQHKQLAQQLFPQAQAKLRTEMPNLRVARNTMGELSIVTRNRTGTVATFDVPDPYLARLLHAERPLPDKVLHLIRSLWFKEQGQTGHGMRDGDENEIDFDSYIKNYKTRGTRYAWHEQTIGGKGVNPTFDELRNGTHGGYHVFTDSMFDDVKRRHIGFVTAMQKLGYVGLEYDGGLRVGGYNRGGGGRAHRAFVFWNGKELAQFRSADTPPNNDFEHDPRAMQRHSLTRVYRPPSQ